jgi:uncharacterized membrane protein
MKTLARILVFGVVSGLLWSAAPGVLAGHFSSRADIPATIVAGILSGVVTSAILGTVVTRFGRGLTVVFGLSSLPLGAFAFGCGLALITQFIPGLAGSTGALVEPWILGINYALLSVISVFAVGLFPLAVGTTLLLRSFIIRARRTDVA